MDTMWERFKHGHNVGGVKEWTHCERVKAWTQCGRGSSMDTMWEGLKNGHIVRGLKHGHSGGGVNPPHKKQTGASY